MLSAVLNRIVARWPRLAQLGRYALTSVVANLTTITVLAVLVGVVGFPAGWSNVVATGVATVPSFELNRRWVWGRDGRRSWAWEVVPFWVWAFVELGLSSLAVHVVGLHAIGAGWSRPTRTLALEATTIGTTGGLWVLQFFLFDRVLFRDRSAPPDLAATQAPLEAVSAVRAPPIERPRQERFSRARDLASRT